MGSRVTIKDIAKKAGVSIGTVSKVLNGDKSVKESNRIAVEEAINALGYRVNKIARGLAKKPIKIGVLLPSAFEFYFDPMLEGIKEAILPLADYKVTAIYKSYAKFDDDEKVIACLKEFSDEEVNGIILGPSHFRGYGNIINELQEKGIPVVLVLSDLINSKRLACICIDAEYSGRTAADLARLALNEGDLVAAFVGNKDVMEHQKKAESFTNRVLELGLKIAGVFETQDDSLLAYQLTVNTLMQNPSLKLIYVATGNSVAVCKAITDAGREDMVKVIATDVIAETKKYVENDIIIGVLDQHLKKQGKVAINTLYQYLSEGFIKEDIIKITPGLLLKSGILNAIEQKTK